MTVPKPYLQGTFAPFGGTFRVPREFDLRQITKDFLTLGIRVDCQLHRRFAFDRLAGIPLPSRGDVMRMLRIASLLLLLASPAFADDLKGKSVTVKVDGLKLGRKLDGGLVRDSDALSIKKSYVVKADDGTFLELAGGRTNWYLRQTYRTAPAPAIAPTDGRY